ncbi:MAG TPA: response regulator, partial [Steroidobacteraceae bacterium]|nr:response regulator [Steroidobacteraceae bacterium]
RQAQPDVIFLDLMMPDVHGFEVLKMLKAIEDTRRIPVVLFTSQRLETEGDRERAAAADALLLKSDLSRDTVIDTMHRVCGVTETDHA